MEIYLNGSIDGYEISEQRLLKDLSAADGGDVTVHINSIGGSFDVGLAIYNYLANYQGSVTTIVDGVAYSMAAALAQAGKVRRMAENAVLMVHGAQTVKSGSAEELRQAADAADAHNDGLKAIFQRKKINNNLIEQWLYSGKNYFFSATQALAAGLVDEISEPVNLEAALRLSSHHPAFLAQYLSNALVSVPKNEALKLMTNPTDIAPNATDSPSGQQAGNQSASKQDAANIPALVAQQNQRYRAGEEAGVKAELKRQTEIRDLFENPMLQNPIFQPGFFNDLRDACLADPMISRERAQQYLFDQMAAAIQPDVNTNQGPPTYQTFPAETPGLIRDDNSQRFHAGEDVMDKFRNGAEMALEMRAHNRVLSAVLPDDLKEKERALQNVNPFLAMTIPEMARHYLQVSNEIQRVSPQMLATREGIVGAALMSGSFTAAGIGHGTSDFQHLLENVANKAMMRGWEEADETWRIWARVGNLPDFKEGSRVNISTFDDLDEIAELGEYKYGTFEDLKEPIILATFGKLFAISRQALANDDLAGLGMTPMKMGRAAARTVGNLAYATLTGNPVLNQDSKEVFHADHNNIGTPGPVDVTPETGSLDEAFTAMALQTDPLGNVLNLTPVHLVTAKAREISTRSTIRDATFFYAGAAQQRENPFRDRLIVTADSRMDQVSSSAWYLLADQNITDTIEVAFKDGNDEPFMESKEGWNIDGIEMKVRIDAGVSALDFRTMFYNAGQ